MRGVSTQLLRSGQLRWKFGSWSSVKEVSGRVFFSIWGAGAPWERPSTDYLKLKLKRDQFKYPSISADSRVVSRHSDVRVSRLSSTHNTTLTSLQHVPRCFQHVSRVDVADNDVAKAYGVRRPTPLVSGLRTRRGPVLEP